MTSYTQAPRSPQWQHYALICMTMLLLLLTAMSVLRAPAFTKAHLRIAPDSIGPERPLRNIPEAHGVPSMQLVAYSSKRREPLSATGSVASAASAASAEGSNKAGFKLVIVAPPTKVEQHQSLSVTIVLAQAELSQIQSMLSVNSSQSQATTVEGGPIAISVRLLEDSGITVTPAEKRRYSIGRAPLTWEFNITARRSGAHRVAVEVEAEYLHNGEVRIMPISTAPLRFEATPAPVSISPETQLTAQYGLLIGVAAAAATLLAPLLKHFLESRRQAAKLRTKQLDATQNDSSLSSECEREDEGSTDFDPAHCCHHHDAVKPRRPRPSKTGLPKASHPCSTACGCHIDSDQEPPRGTTSRLGRRDAR